MRNEGPGRYVVFIIMTGVVGITGTLYIAHSLLSCK